MFGNQENSKVKFLMWEEIFKGLAVAKESSSSLTGMKYMPNKYEDPDNMKSTTHEEKSAANSKKKISLAITYLYQSVNTSKVLDGLPSLAVMISLKYFSHKVWIFLHERFANLDTLSVTELRDEISKIKLK